MTDYLISAVLFVAMVTVLIYLWKREHSVDLGIDCL